MFLHVLLAVLVAAPMAQAAPDLTHLAEVSSDRLVAMATAEPAAKPQAPCPGQVCVGEPTVLMRHADAANRGAHARITFRPSNGLRVRGLVPAAEPDPPRSA